MSASDEPIHVTTASFEREVIDAPTPVIIDFWAPWCAPCRSISPILEALARAHAGRLRVVKINVDEEPALAQAFEVRGIPTLVAIDGREVVDIQVGFRGAQSLHAMAERLAGQRPVAEGAP